MLILGTTLAVLATALVDGGVLLDALTSNAKPDETLAANTRVEAAMLFAIICALPTLLAMWFAPALVVFQNCGPWQAVTTSLRAALANWQPVAVYGLLLFLFGAVLPGIAIALIALLVPPFAAPYVIALVVVPMSSCSWPRRRSRTTSPTATSFMPARVARRTFPRRAARPPPASRIRAPAT